MKIPVLMTALAAWPVTCLTNSESRAVKEAVCTMPHEVFSTLSKLIRPPVHGVVQDHSWKRPISQLGGLQPLEEHVLVCSPVGNSPTMLRYAAINSRCVAYHEDADFSQRPLHS